MNNRQAWIDQARGIALLFVVIGHMGVPYLGQFFTTVHLPLFFFLSGLTFSVKCSFATFLKRKARRLLIPYFCLGIPLVISSFITRAVAGVTDLSAYLEVLFEFLIQQRMYTIWFLPCLFIASVLLYAILKLAKKRFGLILCTCGALGIAGMIYWEFGGTSLPWNVDAAIVALAFMGMGYCVAQTDWIHKAQSFKSWVIFFAVAAIYGGCVAINGFVVGEKFDMAMCWGGSIPVSLIAIVAGIYCIIFFTKRFRIGIFEYLGQNTMVYFAWHQSIVLPLLMWGYDLLGWFKTDNIVSDGMRTVLTIFLICAVLYPIDLLVRKTKLRFVVGK